MSFLLLILYFVILSLFLVKWKWVRRMGVKDHVLVILFFVKVIAGFGLVYLYGHYYDPNHSDIYLYFNDSIFLKQAFLHDRTFFWNIIFEHNMASASMMEKCEPLRYWSSGHVDFIIHEKKLVILVNFLFSFISWNNIYIHSMLMAFLAFIGQMGLYKFIRKQTHIPSLIILAVVFLIPTVLLWSSTLLKESLIIFSVGMLLYYVGKWSQKWSLKYLIFSAGFFTLGLLIKPYVIFSLCFPLIIFLLFKIFKNLRFRQQSWIVVSGFFLILLSLWALSHTNHSPLQALSNKQSEFVNLITQVEGNNHAVVGSKMEINRLNPTIPSLLLNAPKALVNVMFKPNFLDYQKPLYWLDILQNISVVILSLFALIYYRKPTQQERPFLWLVVLYLICLFTIVGLVTPVLGAIVRYKMPALPFLFMLIFTFLKETPSLKKMNGLVFKS